MRYKRFIIKNYRAITGPLEIRMDKGSLTPIIGINESGKTTILQAIFAFDHYNDDFNGGRHLKDVSNLYNSSAPTATVEAEVEITPTELKRVFAQCQKDFASESTVYEELQRRKKLPSKLVIKRTISDGKYTLSGDYYGNNEIQNAIAEQMLTSLPYILYFDDFRDKIAEQIEIPQKGSTTGEWIEILEQLFTQTDKTLSVYDLANLEVRQRKSVLSKVQRHLNATLTREWQSFRLDDRDALKIHIEFHEESQPPGPPQQQIKHYLRLEVVETDEKGNEHFFFISDRSKGFYWFFNFVMKLEFNPKVTDSAEHSVYLLDEPGSYLHAYAQRKLCQKLRHLSEKNHVMYCTHSHYLLDPEIIPINCVMVADKDGSGCVGLTRMIDYEGVVTEKRSALQPVMDALKIKPYALDLIHTQATVITEGIYDYFCLELFKGDKKVSILPSVGADSIKFYISLMIAWQVPFRALWDNDPEGRKQHQQASEKFGSQIAGERLRLLPGGTPTGHYIMQNLFEGSDMALIRGELGLDQNSSFERTILALFYSPERNRIVQEISEQTKGRFDELHKALSF